MHFTATQFSHAEVQLELLVAAGTEPSLEGVAHPGRIPYWSVLWPSTAVFGKWLVDQGYWQDTPVLELGCGAGLVGLAVAALGARVTQTDLFPEAVQLARRNALRNGLPATRQVAGDWHRWPLRSRWPVILGNDLTYERDSHAYLLEVLERALTEGGVAYLADPGRPMTLDFLARAEREGWEVGLDALPGSTSVEPAYLYRFRR